MKKKETRNSEEIILAQVVKRDGMLAMKHSKSASQYEVYGFLKMYLEVMEQQLFDGFETTDEFELF